jgi:UDP-N-acetylmuramate--alanine ligase
MDADHLDIYGDHQTLIDCYKQFSNQVAANGTLILKKGLAVNAKAAVIEYSITESAKALAENISVENGNYVFDYRYENREIKNLQLGLAGRHNIENAVAAVTAVIQYDLSDEQIKMGLASYTGVKRRYDVQVKNDYVIYIDDYAHHPEELNATILSVKELYPDKKLTVIFQPHLFTRTRDFAKEFAAALSLPDETILLPIYPARELPIEGVDANMICQLMTNKKMICEKCDLLKVIADKKIEVLLTLGAGDIDQFVAPIKELLNTKYLN